MLTSAGFMQNDTLFATSCNGFREEFLIHPLRSDRSSDFVLYVLPLAQMIRAPYFLDKNSVSSDYIVCGFTSMCAPAPAAVSINSCTSL